MSLRRWIKLNGFSRGFRLWLIQGRLRSELRRARYIDEHEQPFRVAHGDKPKLTGYRRQK